MLADGGQGGAGIGLDTATGRIRWQWSLPSFTAAYGDPATPNWTVAGGTLLDDAPVATYTEPLVPLDVMAYGFNPQTGALKWQMRSPDPGECVPDGQNAPVAVTGEILAVGLECSSASNPNQNRDQVFAYSTASGHRAWSRTWDGSPVSMAFSSSPGLLAVDTGSASAPDLTFLDAQTGRKLASFRQSGAVIGETLTEHTLTSGTPPLLLQGSGGSPEVTVTAFGDGTQPLWKTTLGWPGLADPSETLLLTTQAGQETYLVGLGATSATIAVYGIGADGSHPAAPALLPIPAYGGIDRVLTTPRRLILEIDEPRADAASIDLYGIG